MARYRGPRNRIARREGLDLGLKTSGSDAHTSLLKRIKVPPGQHGQKGTRKISDYGKQLRAKQKVKRMYGILEKQFQKYFEKASRSTTNTGEQLLTLLERRLDNVVFRMGFAPTRAAARQFVSHGHIIVDGKKVNIPSYQTRKDMVITVTPKLLKTPLIIKLLEEKNKPEMSWVQIKGPVGKIVRLPIREDILDDINEQLIIEFYSR